MAETIVRTATDKSIPANENSPLVEPDACRQSAHRPFYGWFVVAAGEQNTPSLGKTVDIFMLAVTGGKERTLDQHRDLLRSADFRLRRTIPVSDELMIFEAVPV